LLGRLAALLNRIGLGSVVARGDRALSRTILAKPLVIEYDGLRFQASLESHRLLQSLEAGDYDYELDSSSRPCNPA
jgi:hypothetical protein